MDAETLIEEIQDTVEGWDSGNISPDDAVYEIERLMEMYFSD